MSKPEADNSVIKRMTLTEFGAVSVKQKSPQEIEAHRSQELEHLRQQAYQEGFNQGLQDGVAAGRQQVETLQEQLHYVASIFQHPLTQCDELVERELVQLAVAVAKQIVRRELKTDPGQVISVVREAVATLATSAQNIKIHLHPDDAEIVRKVMLSGDDEQAWVLVEDPILQRGGCHLTTASSDVDATIESRVAAIAAKLLGGERAGDE